MHQNSPFSDKKSKKFLGREHGPLLRPLPQWRGGHPLPTLYPPSAPSAPRLALTALGPPNFKTALDTHIIFDT